MKYIAFDLVILMLLLLSLWRGYYRGFILTLCGFLAIFVAFIGAAFVSDFLAEPIARTIQPLVEQGIQNILQDYTAQAASPEMDLTLEQALSVLRESELLQSFAHAIETAVSDGFVGLSVGAVRAIAGYMALRIAEMLLFVISFLLILVVWMLLSHALDLAFHLPVLSALNHWSGALLGLLKGIVLLFIAAWLLKDSLVPPDAIDKTYLLRFFCTSDPLALLLTLLPMLSQFS